MKNQTLQYYMHDGPSAFRFELANYIDEEGARELFQAWRTASSVVGNRVLIVDLTFVTGASEGGRSLISRWHAEGAQLVARSKSSRKLAETIIGEPLGDSDSGASGGRTWLPFNAPVGMRRLRMAVAIAALLLPVQAHAANLRAETVTAWNDYVRSVSSGMQDRARDGGHFLWADENADRLARVRNGEIVVAPAPGHNPRLVPGGLIHHWIAAAFFPKTTLKNVLDITQDYDRYREFYPPSVIVSKTIARETPYDSFSMQLTNQAFFLRTTFDADYQATNVRSGDRRFYSISRTTRVQEIEDYARAGEHRFPEGEGSGYVWKLFGVFRAEERGDGVYVELEAIALSRDIPAALRLVTDPIVRRVSRNSIRISLRQTQEAVCSSAVAVGKSAGATATAEQMHGVSAEILESKSPFIRFH